MSTTPHDAYRTTYHRDGTVTYWDIYTQTWSREAAVDISDATHGCVMTNEERVA